MKKPELEKLLRQYGCYYLDDGGNHETWYSPITGKKFPVWRHKGQDIKPGTLRKILKESGIKP